MHGDQGFPEARATTQDATAARPDNPPTMSDPSAMNTDQVAPAERAAVWRDWIWTHFGGLESDLYGDDTFDGRMAASRAGDVILTRLEANRHRVIKSPRLAQAAEVPITSSSRVVPSGARARRQTITCSSKKDPDARIDQFRKKHMRPMHTTTSDGF